jgi:hypothetical protein
VPQAAALEQLVRRHAREHLWRAPVGGPYRVAVPHAMFEELRSHLAYECFDVAHLPAVATAAVVANDGLVRVAFAAGVATPAGPVRDCGRKRASPPASTQISAVAQLLGEIRVDERDKEWMYALNGATGDANGVGLKLVRAQNVDHAAARARAILHGALSDAEPTEEITVNASDGANMSEAAHATPERDHNASQLSLACVNRAFTLAAEIVRARDQADEAGTPGVVRSLSQQLELLLCSMEVAAETVAAIRAVVS